MRKIIAIFLILLFVPIFAGFLMILNLRLTLLSPTFLKSQLRKGKVYEEMATEIPKLLVERIEEEVKAKKGGRIPPLPEEIPPEIRRRITNIDTFQNRVDKIKDELEVGAKKIIAKDIQEISEEGIDQFFAVLYGESQDPVVRISLKNIKGKIMSELDPNDPMTKELEGSVPNILKFNLKENSEREGSILRFLTPFLIVLALLVTGCLFLIGLVVGPPFKTRIRWICIALLPPSLILLLYALVAPPLLKSITFNPFGGADFPISGKVGSAIIISLKSLLITPLAYIRWETLAIAVLAIGGIVVSFYLPPSAQSIRSSKS